jgi:hypothetical protein
MKAASGQIKLLGFAGSRVVTDPAVQRMAIVAGLSEMKAALGDRMTVICGAGPGADLVFLRACVEMRIPAIVFLPFPEERLGEDFPNREEWAFAQHLMGVALAKYVVPGGGYDGVSRHLLDWADAFLFEAGENSLRSEVLDLGIPSRVIDGPGFVGRWEVAPDPRRDARHGFDNRADLLDFLDARFAAG